ncbi:DUF3087 family protein [Halopseudomonas maritima]|uniref:DUF3087 family protein n=1 Tax=Halopseudomonas maritima TaxID=2918528 RepID=UPI001EECD00F|nr:DUF3087 domain-containing protein [Halopseudomonas maritima]
MFRIEHRNPEHFRQQTRRSSLILVLVFAALGMGLSTLLVQVFGSPEGSNFRWNLAGVLLGLGITLALVRWVFSGQQWMESAVYGWRLKRALMRITNQLHTLRARVEAGDEQALLAMRFYHLGLQEMHRLDGNTAELLDTVAEREALRAQLLQRGLSDEQPVLYSDWLEAR